MLHHALQAVLSLPLLLCTFACGMDHKAREGLAAPGPEGAERLLVLVSNEVSNDVAFIDPESERVLGTLRVGQRPRGLRVSPDGQTLFVALSGSPRGGPNVDESKLPPPDRSQDGIGRVELASGLLLGTLPGGNDPESLDTSPDGRYLAVANEDSSEASLIDTRTGGVIARLPVGVEPEGVRFSPDGGAVYVTSEGSNRVDVIDVGARRVVRTIATGRRPRSVVFNPEGDRAYVSCELDARIDVIDARAHRALGSVAIEGEPRALPMGLALDDSRDRLYVALGRAGDIAVVDTGALRLIGRVRNVGARPWGLALSPDGEKLFSANGPSGDVSVIDASTLRVIRRIPSGASPWGLATVRVRELPSALVSGS